MSSQVYLVSQTNRDPKSGICALCGCNFELLSAAVVVYDGHLPLGNLCQACSVDGPSKVALKIRERAKKLYAYANGIRKSPVANQCEGTTDILHRCWGDREKAAAVVKVVSK